MRGIGVVLAVLGVLATWVGPVMAREPSQASLHQVMMSEMVVSASRELESVERVPAYVSVIDALDIAKSNARNVPELLRTTTGVHVSDISGNRRNYNVDLRGFGESSQQNILFLVDGRRVNLQDLSGPDWNLIPLDRIERIEVIRGSRGSVMYGDNATAGVINIITKADAGLFSTSAIVETGSYQTHKAAMSGSAMSGNTGLNITGALSDSEGYRDNSESSAMDLGVNLDVDPTGRLHLYLSTGYHHDDTRNPGALIDDDYDAGKERTDTTHPDDFDRVQDQYVKTGLALDILSNDTFKIDASLRNRDKESHGTFTGGTYVFDADTQSDIITASAQLIFREDFEGVANQVVLGYDYTDGEQSYDSLSYDSISDTYDPIRTDLRKVNSAYFIQDTLRVGDHLSLDMGYRSDRAVFKYKDAQRSERIFDEAAYDFGINYMFKRNTHLYFAYNHGFRYPVMDEQFNYFYSTVNTSVDPQLSDNFEVGAAMEALPGLTFTTNCFRIETRHEIFFNASPDVYDNDNMEGKTLRQGIELGVRWLGRAMQAGLGFTYTDTEMDDGPYQGKQVPNVPNHKATANLAYQWAMGLSLGMDAVYVGERFLISDLNNSQDKAEAYTLVNAKAQYEWQSIVFFLNLNNLFNTSYSAYNVLTYNDLWEEVAGEYPSPEFNFMLGFTMRYEGS